MFRLNALGMTGIGLLLVVIVLMGVGLSRGNMSEDIVSRNDATVKIYEFRAICYGDTMVTFGVTGLTSEQGAYVAFPLGMDPAECEIEILNELPLQAGGYKARLKPYHEN